MIFKLLLLINIAIIGINAAIFIILVNNQSFVAVDFNSLYTGFKIVGNGDGAKLYDLDLQTKYQQEIMRNAQFEEGVLPYVTAPFIAILFSPLSKVSINVAFYIWTFGEVLLLIWSLLLINKLFTSWTKKERLCTLLTILAFWPLTLTFLLGQLSLILFFCLFQMYLAFRKLQYYKSGIWLALLSAKPQVLLIPFFITTNKRRFRSALSVIISCFSLFILTGIILGFSSWRQYIDLLLFIGSKFGKYGYHPELQYTLRGLLTTIFGYQHSSLINILSSATFIIGSLFIGLLWGRFHSEDITRFNLYFAFTPFC